MSTEVYEVTWIHLGILYLGVLILTYPCSLLLVSIGHIKTTDGDSRLKRVFRKSNEIAKEQLMLIFIAWLIGMLLTTAWMFLSGFVLGLLSLVGIISTRAIKFETVILAGGVVIHFIVQIKAYVFALSQVKKADKHKRSPMPKVRKQRSAKEEHFWNNLGIRLKVGRRDQGVDQIQK